MNADDKRARASAFIDTLDDVDLAEATPWKVAERSFLRWDEARKLLNRARLERGIITVLDLTPGERRELVDPAKLDLHALAAGPIMHVSEIYLPAGRLSMADTRERERRAMGGG